MRALVVTRPGGPEVLEVRDVAEPQAKAGEALVQVEACGVNFADTMMTRGRYPGTPAPPFVAGREFAGRIVDSGERVMGYTQRDACAERIAIGRDSIWPVPEGWSASEGAAFPVNYFTAYFAYFLAGMLDESPCPLSNLHHNRPRVLIHAAAGGVGTAAIAIGKILNVEMYGTSSSAEKLAKLREMGLDHGINYKEVDYEKAIADLTHGEGVDAVFEMLGGEHTAKSTRCLRDFGRVILYGSASGRQPEFDIRAMYSRMASAIGLWLSAASGKPHLMKPAWNRISQWTREGKWRPIVGHVLPLNQAAEAYRLLLERKNFGKVVLTL